MLHQIRLPLEAIERVTFLLVERYPDPDVDALLKIARQAGALASSGFGAGFGGAVYAMLPRDNVAEFTRQWSDAYFKSFPEREADAFWLVSNPSGAARKLDL